MIDHADMRLRLGESCGLFEVRDADLGEVPFWKVDVTLF